VRLEAKAVVVPGDDIDTDVLYPGTYLNVTDVEVMKQYLFEGLDPSLRDELGGETALVVGANFGAGSSREHVLDAGLVEVDGAAFPIPPFPPFMREMMASGGLVGWVRGNLDATTRVV